MKNQILFLLSEGLRGFRYSREGVTASIFTIGICTAALGISAMVFSGMYGEIVNLKIDTSLRVFIAQSHEGPEAVKTVEDKIRSIPFIDSLTYITKEEALLEFKSEFNEDMVEVLPYNPLPPSFIIHPEEYYESGVRQQNLRQQLLEVEGVEAVSQGTPFLLWLDKWKVPVFLLGGAMVVFILISLSMILSNAVKLNLFTRKLLVDNMKYCGAAEMFIVLPFLLEGLILGLLGSAIGLALASLFYFMIEILFPGILSVNLPLIFLTVVAVCSALTALSAYRTVKKFIHVI